MGKWHTHSRHHKREPRGQPFPSRWPQSTYKQTRTKHSKHKTEQKHKRSTKEVPPWNGLFHTSFHAAVLRCCEMFYRVARLLQKQKLNFCMFIFLRSLCDLMRMQDCCKTRNVIVWLTVELAFMYLACHCRKTVAWLHYCTCESLANLHDHLATALNLNLRQSYCCLTFSENPRLRKIAQPNVRTIDVKQALMTIQNKV